MKLHALDVVPTTVYSPDRKRFHPAVRSGLSVMFWENITFENEDEAYEHAYAATTDALDAANVVVEGWNLTRL